MLGCYAFNGLYGHVLSQLYQLLIVEANPEFQQGEASWAGTCEVVEAADIHSYLG